jgi:probable phosphoglycerate mutase
MDLVLIRHARPHRIEDAGTPADPELTDLGHRQAEAMARWLADEHFDALYTSPMVRARQTMAPLERAMEMTADVVEGVKEYDAKSPEYIPIEDLKADKDRWHDFLTNHVQEDRTDFGRLVVATIEELIGRHRGDRIAVVCHGGVVNVWAAHILGLGPQMFFEPFYTSVNRFVAASTGQRSVTSLNEVGHLRALDRS